MLTGVANKCFTEETTSKLGLEEHVRFCEKKGLSGKNKTKNSMCSREVLKTEAERQVYRPAKYLQLYHVGTRGVAEFFRM